MRFVALVSGGKDSICSIIECQRNGHELVACVHLAAPVSEQEESYMYQTAASEVLPTLVEECLGVPLIMHRRVGTSVNTSLVYEKQNQSTPTSSSEHHDEVEDLYQALATAVERFPSTEAVSSGAILSTYQRVRIENVCSRLGLTSLSYLWRIAPQKDLLKRIIVDDDITAVLVKTACPPGLMPRKHLNKTLAELYHSGLFQRLHDKYQFHMCGEGGEYETLVLDCPIYKKKLVLDQVQIVETDDNDGVGVLIVQKCHAEDKMQQQQQEETAPKSAAIQAIKPSVSEETGDNNNNVRMESSVPACIPCVPLPHVRRGCGGLLHLSEIMSPIPAFAGNETSQDDNEGELAVKEALAVFELLDQTLSRHGITAQDVVFVHLYLSEISHFAKINTHYKTFFGTLLPPSRSCVAVGKHVLPGGRRVLLDCMVQCGSGRYMRECSSTAIDDNQQEEDAYASAARLTTTSKLRHVLHVQSISYWAPVCVGPYSQANTLRSGLHFLAGQIGLIPATMKLHTLWTRQLEQCWMNVASVLDALDSGSLEHMLSGLIYVSNQVYAQQGENVWQMVESISRQQLSTNGGVATGLVDSVAVSGMQYGGYEDEGTWREMTKEQNNTAEMNLDLPLLVVSIPEMPVGASVEVETICVTQRAASCLEMETTTSQVSCTESTPPVVEATVQWGTGHDFPFSRSDRDDDDIRINVASRSIGHGCAAVSIVTASALSSEQGEAIDRLTTIDMEQVLDDMMDAWAQTVTTETSGLSLNQVLHIRLYYVGSLFSDSLLGEEKVSIKAIDDGSRLRCALHSVVASRWCQKRRLRRTNNIPACTVVPVQGMKLMQTESVESPTSNEDAGQYTFLAMHLLVADPVHMETEMWIHHGREEANY